VAENPQKPKEVVKTVKKELKEYPMTKMIGKSEGNTRVKLVTLPSLK